MGIMAGLGEAFEAYGEVRGALALGEARAAAATAGVVADVVAELGAALVDAEARAAAAEDEADALREELWEARAMIARLRAARH